MGSPGGTGAERLQFGGLHLAGSKITSLKAANRPGHGLLRHPQGAAAWVGEGGAPMAALLNAADPGVDDLAPTPPRGWGVFFRTQASSLQQGLPDLEARWLVLVSLAGQGCEIHRPGAAQSHLQIAAVEQRVKACHGDWQHHKRAGGSGWQGPAFGQLRGGELA